MKLLKIYLVLICASLLYSCSPAWYQRRDVKKLDALSIQQPSEFLRLSNLINPCFNGKAKSDTVIQNDTTYTKGDTVEAFQHDTLKLTIKLPGKNITKMTTVHDTVTDGRKVADLQAQLKDCSTTQTEATTRLLDQQAISKKRLWLIIGLASAIGVFVVIKVYTFFSGGGIASAVKKVI